MGKWRYAVILDAGSSGTRVHVYRWLDSVKARKGASEHELKSLPVIKSKDNWTKKTHPGVSSFSATPENIGPDHLEDLLDHALEIVPIDAVPDTPVFLLATAGMRLLPNLEQKLLLQNICDFARSHTDFLLPDCDLHIQVIPGETEGLYGWIATNYLLSGFDTPDEHEHGKGHHTYGFLDMGGASAQIAFAPNATEAEKHANDLKLLRLRNLDGSSTEYQVFVTSWLEFGVRRSRERYVTALQESLGHPDIHELPDPCLPAGLRTTVEGEAFSADADISGKKPYLLGTGKFDECLRQTYPLLDKDAPCEDTPCLLHGTHVPAIDFDVNHFIGISEYWHTTHQIFEMGHKDKAYDFNTYQERVNEFCSQDWDVITDGVANRKWGKKVDTKTAYEVCFKASWIINMLHDGIGIPRVGLEDTLGSGHNGTKEVLEAGKQHGYLAPFQAVNKIDSTEVSWTLGKVVLYAASQVPPVEDVDALPVGFGSNVAGVPADFQYPGSPLQSLPDSEDSLDGHAGEQWHDALFDGDSPRRVPGILLFLFIILIVIFFLLGRDRRTRIYRKISYTLGCGGRRGDKKRGLFSGKIPFLGSSTGYNYERVLEDGAQDYELSSQEGSHSHQRNDSDSSSSTAPKLRRTSSWGASPTLKFELSHGNASTQSVGLGITPLIPSGNALDRAGLVVRTESREHLSPMVLGPTTNGRKSRTGSPTRSQHKSPKLSPLADD